MTHFFIKKGNPHVGVMLLSPLIRWGLVLSWLSLALGKGRLLVARGAAPKLSRRVRGGVVAGRIPVVLGKVVHSLAIPSKCKEEQQTLMGEDFVR